MLRSRTCRLSLLTLVAAVGAAASTAPAASAATQRYASPAGSDPACSSASPCSLTQAITGASTGDEVIVNPGDYPVTAVLSDPAPITIHGAAGQPRPRLVFTGGGTNWLELTKGSTLRYVELHQTGSSRALQALDAKVDQVIAKAPNFTVGIQNSTIRNSVVVATGSSGNAIGTGTIATSTVTLRNVTAIATGSGGVAIQAWAHSGAGNATIFATNVIARGGPGGHSFKALADTSGDYATITVTHSNWLNGLGVGANAAVVNGGANQGYTPAFVNAAAGDYRQAAGSPTIDAGLNDPFNGAFDVDGDPRKIGTTDIGADEFVVAPAATTGPAGAVTDESAALSGSVNPGGAPTSYHFEYGPTTAYGSTTSTTGAGAGTSALPAGATLGGLSAATTYHYRVVATNSGGVTKGGDRTFTTASPPPPPPTPPPPTPTPPPPPAATLPATTPTSTTPTFAGVKLVSTRLSFGGRSVTLRLNCPAGTVGRCSGRTKLTARRRASSRAASSVTLGSARFSIAAGKQAKVRVRVSRAGRRLLSGVRRLRGKDTNAARNGAGQSKTTVAAVTIRRRHS
jgi:hypothetical protein